MMRSPQVLDWLVAAFPERPDLHTAALRLAQEPDDRANLVAAELVQLGILRPGLKGHYLLNSRPEPGEPVPEGLFRRSPGPVAGLSREDFVAELHRNDELYTAVFWPVWSAFLAGKISPADAPAFLRQYAG